MSHHGHSESCLNSVRVFVEIWINPSLNLWWASLSTSVSGNTSGLRQNIQAMCSLPHICVSTVFNYPVPKALHKYFLFCLVLLAVLLPE